MNPIKHVVTGKARGAPGAAVPAFARFLGDRPEIVRCALHVAIEDAIGPNGEQTSDGVNLIAECWTVDHRSLDLIRMPLADPAAYRVREVVEKGARGTAPGPAPGISVLARLTAKPGMTVREAVAGYDRHPLTALRVHFGMEYYIRNVTEVVETHGASPYFGFSLLHYACDEDRAEKHYDSPEGRQAIRDDIASFLDTAKLQVMEARSWLLR
ncbi:MAG TPA: hypothetical protein VJM34_02440 [Novosphingobium sp.]|nr:hypothetical protein [Novosphingobium sp.]